MKLKELAELIGGRISGNPDIEITGVAGISDAQKGDISFVSDKTGAPAAPVTDASALIVKKAIKESPITMVVADNPQHAFARALEVFHVKPYTASGVSEEAFIGSNVRMGEGVSVYPKVYVSDNTIIGTGVTLSPGVFLGEGVTIGDGSFIHPNVTIREKVTVGKNVIVHAGAVIGSDGFGYVPDKGRHYKIPQVGSVIIDDNVEIGANACIDRGTTGNTVIGSGTKIDNLVQIAHNVKIGEHCIIVAQVGISGSVEVGDGAILAGQVGVRDHVKIGSHAIVAAQAGIAGDIPDGHVYSGTPAIPHKTSLRSQYIYARLHDYITRLQQIEKKLNREEQSDDEHS